MNLEKHKKIAKNGGFSCRYCKINNAWLGAKMIVWMCALSFCCLLFSFFSCLFFFYSLFFFGGDIVFCLSYVLSLLALACYPNIAKQPKYSKLRKTAKIFVINKNVFSYLIIQYNTSCFWFNIYIYIHIQVNHYKKQCIFGTF